MALRRLLRICSVLLTFWKGQHLGGGFLDSCAGVHLPPQPRHGKHLLDVLQFVGGEVPTVRRGQRVTVNRPAFPSLGSLQACQPCLRKSRKSCGSIQRHEVLRWRKTDNFCSGNKPSLNTGNLLILTKTLERLTMSEHCEVCGEPITKEKIEPIPVAAYNGKTSYWLMRACRWCRQPLPRQDNIEYNKGNAG